MTYAYKVKHHNKRIWNDVKHNDEWKTHLWWTYEYIRRKIIRRVNESKNGFWKNTTIIRDVKISHRTFKNKRICSLYSGHRRVKSVTVRLMNDSKEVRNNTTLTTAPESASRASSYRLLIDWLLRIIVINNYYFSHPEPQHTTI